MVVVVEFPPVTEALVGDRLIVKSGEAVTVMVTALEVDETKFASPPYEAVIEAMPTGSVVIERVAIPLPFKVPVPRAVVPFRKVTVPVGTVVFPAGPATDAVKVTLVPKVIEVADAASLVVEAVGVIVAATTVTVTAGEEEVAKLESPAYEAVMECVPTAKVVMARVATPDPFNVPVPRDVVPSRNVTVPVGTVVSPLGPTTVAVRVTLCPAVTEVGEAASAVVEVATGVVVAEDPV
jgi:hypothetical protein